MFHRQKKVWDPETEKKYQGNHKQMEIGKMEARKNSWEKG